MHFRRMKGPSLACGTPGTIFKRAWQQLKKRLPCNTPKPDDSVLATGSLVFTPSLVPTPSMIYRPRLTTVSRAGFPAQRVSLPTKPQMKTRGNDMKGLDQGRGLFLGPALACLLVLPAVVPVKAQQVTGMLGSPSATSTISGKQLPPPAPKFGGVIKESATESIPWWPPRVVPPAGAPNVLLIMTDDAGYGVASTFGGMIPTPALDRVASNGLRYTRMHSTALCSPTRAAIITGRNHHSAGFGVISELSTGYPGYDSIITKDKATIGTILKENGYATSWFGKDHNTPAFQVGTAGPFDQWPSGMGFDYFYGFVSGETSQWFPFLFRDHTQIFPWNKVTVKPGPQQFTDADKKAAAEAYARASD